MVWCAVATCRSSEKSGVSFFAFPKDPSRRTKWAHRCARGDNIVLKNARICSKHFTEEDLDPSYLVKRALMPNVRAGLRDGAVPSVNLPSSTSILTLSRKEGKRKERQEKRDRRALVEQLLRDHAASSSSPSLLSVPTMSNCTPEQGIAMYMSSGKQQRKGATVTAETRAGTTSVGSAPFTSTPSTGDETIHLKHRDEGGQERVTAMLLDDSASPASRFEVLDIIPCVEDDDTAFGDGRGGFVENDGVASPEDMRDRDRKAPACDVDRQEITPGNHLLPQLQPPPIGTAANDYRPPAARLSIVSSTKELLQKRHKVKELEETYRQLNYGSMSLGVSNDPAETDNWVNKDVPLVTLRSHSVRSRDIMTKLSKHELSDDVEMFPPASMDEALDIIHQLRMKNLSMRETFLKWVIKNKKRMAQKENDAQQRSNRTVSKMVKHKRLKELLELEVSVKDIFTEQQIKAMASDYSLQCSENKKVVHWREEDMRRALELQAIGSEKVLNYVRHKMRIPLPCMMTVRKRFEQFPELKEMYKAMMKSRRSAEHCKMCRSQLGTIEAVAEGPSAAGTDGALEDHRFREDRLDAYVDQACNDPPLRRKSAVKTKRQRQVLSPRKKGGLGKRGPESPGWPVQRKKPNRTEWDESELSDDERCGGVVQAMHGWRQVHATH